MASINPLLISTSNNGAQAGGISALSPSSAPQKPNEINPEQPITAGNPRNKASFTHGEQPSGLFTPGNTSTKSDKSQDQHFMLFRDHFELELNELAQSEAADKSNHAPIFAATGQSVATDLPLQAASVNGVNDSLIQGQSAQSSMLVTEAKLVDPSSTAQAIVASANDAALRSANGEGLNSQSLGQNSALTNAINTNGIKLEGSLKSDDKSTLKILPTVSASNLSQSSGVPAASVPVSAVIQENTASFITDVNKKPDNGLNSSGLTSTLAGVNQGQGLTNIAETTTSTVNPNNIANLGNANIGNVVSSTSISNADVSITNGNSTNVGSTNVGSTNVDSTNLNSTSASSSTVNSSILNSTSMTSGADVINNANIAVSSDTTQLSAAQTNLAENKSTSAQANAETLQASTNLGLNTNTQSQNLQTTYSSNQAGTMAQPASAQSSLVQSTTGTQSLAQGGELGVNAMSQAGLENTANNSGVNAQAGAQSTLAGLTQSAKTDFSDMLNTAEGQLGEQTGEETAEESARPTLNRITTTPTGLSNVSYRMVDGQPVATSFATTTFGQPGWSEQVANQVAWFSSKNVREAEIQLAPPELGALQVRVSMTQEQASVSFTSPNATVREALDQSVARLREMFDEQQIDLVDVDVSSGQSHDESLAQEPQDGEAHLANAEEQTTDRLEAENVSTVTVEVKQGLVNEVV